MCFASGRVKTTMHVAVNGPKGKGESETTDFYKVETWGKLAELAGKYLGKGNQVGVTGRLSLDHWVDKQGHNRVTPVVEATQIALPPKNRSNLGDDAVSSLMSSARGEVDVSDEDDETSDESEDTDYGVPDRAESAPPDRSSRRRNPAYSTA
jgi:single stranded DNA-binding protein